MSDPIIDDCMTLFLKNSLVDVVYEGSEDYDLPVDIQNEVDKSAKSMFAELQNRQLKIRTLMLNSQDTYLEIFGNPNPVVMVEGIQEANEYDVIHYPYNNADENGKKVFSFFGLVSEKAENVISIDEGNSSLNLIDGVDNKKYKWNSVEDLIPNVLISQLSDSFGDAEGFSDEGIDINEIISDEKLFYYSEQGSLNV